MHKALASLAVVALLVAIAWFMKPHIQAPLEDTLTHIQTTKTIRCGWLPYEPFLIQDPNTGQLSGIVVDYFNEIGKREGYTIDWSVKLAINDILPSLGARKIDAFCAPCSPNAEYKKLMNFNIPFGHIPYYLYTSTKNPIPNNNLPTSSFAYVDGFIPMVLTHQIYPSATLVGLTSNASVAELFDQLRYGKADALISEGVTASNYIRNNLNVIQRNPAMEPRITPMWIPTRKDDTQMGAFLTNLFGLQREDNKAIFLKLLEKYQLPKDVYCLDLKDCQGIPHNL